MTYVMPDAAKSAMHQEQQYVFEASRKLGIEARLVGHDLETKTCREKADLLGWPVERVVKALYFYFRHERDERSYFVGIITPETDRKVDTQALVSYLFKPLPESGRFYQDLKIPKGMAHGTCTPFPRRSLFGSKVQVPIDQLLIFDFPQLQEQLVDISVGGGGSDAKRTSMHLKYGAIFDILQDQFPKSVQKVEPRFLD